MDDIPSCLKVWDYPGANQIMNSEQLEVPSENVRTSQNSSDSDSQSVKEQKVQVVDKVFMIDTSWIMCHCAIDTHFYYYFFSSSRKYQEISNVLVGQKRSTRLVVVQVLGGLLQ